MTDTNDPNFIIGRAIGASLDRVEKDHITRGQIKTALKQALYEAQGVLNDWYSDKQISQEAYDEAFDRLVILQGAFISWLD